jgi:hypothetical protein
MPRRAWVEIRNRDGRLLRELPATIAGGAIQAKIPGFPPDTLGTIKVRAEPEEEFGDGELQELPTGPQLLIYQIG